MRECHCRPRALFPATADIANSAPDSAWPFAELGCQQVAASREGPVWLGAPQGKALEAVGDGGRRACTLKPHGPCSLQAGRPCRGL